MRRLDINGIERFVIIKAPPVHYLLINFGMSSILLPRRSKILVRID
jgi:hypothetical protein